MVCTLELLEMNFVCSIIQVKIKQTSDLLMIQYQTLNEGLMTQHSLSKTKLENNINKTP